MAIYDAGCSSRYHQKSSGLITSELSAIRHTGNQADGLIEFRQLLQKVQQLRPGPGMGDEVTLTVAGVYERAQNPWMRSGKRTMFLTLEDAYGLFECVCFESKLARIAPVVARTSYFLVRGRLQNNHKRGLAIVAEEVLDLEEVLGKRRTANRATTSAATRPARGDGRSQAGHPEAGRNGQAVQEPGSPGREMPPIPDAVDLQGRREKETYGSGALSGKRRPPGAGTGPSPSAWDEVTKS